MVAGDSSRAASGSSMALASGTMPGSIITRTSPSRTNATVEATRFTDEVALLFTYPLKRIWTSADEAHGRSLFVTIVSLAFLATTFENLLSHMLNSSRHTAITLVAHLLLALFPASIQ